MSEPRRLEVLRAIVEDYVHSREPVGSKALVDRHQLGVSSATIRNDMAVLEEEGLIAAPHTSSGRIPTDKGYRLFVDRISEVKPLSAAEKNAIQSLLDGAEDLDDVMARTVRLLAQLTNQVAVVQFPRAQGASVRHVECVLVAPQQVLMVLIATNGSVQQRVVWMPMEIREAELSELKQRLQSAVSGLKLSALPAALDAVLPQLPPALRAHGGTMAGALGQLADLGRDDRIVLAGTANLARFTGDFPLSIGPVLEALEEQVVMLRLLSEMEFDARGISVRIGSENPYGGLSEASVVATGYGPDAGARLGVLGPTRMDYPTTMAAVRAVARYVSRVLEE
ncbi:heat-inducible transcriptional repressor HrcA [Arthrobacter echini]|uniref:Heat-inducible transcription repressor HrcA n=1 Tax=Arthrobacter echini TaxID=1529066 RepID=A0A5D0XT66_9MICC|nr:heat-inducible transcriptional repressor HrcA [Arthrobacter echini]TYC99378.1 heat-inducible transcriptional repressor HrcA [Arthrobacter echini]